VRWCQLCYIFGLYLPMCLSDGYFFCGATFFSDFFLVVSILLFLSRGVVCLGCWWSFCVLQPPRHELYNFESVYEFIQRACTVFRTVIL
jgi:hypothetical protein